MADDRLMSIRYSDHLLMRLRMRGIPYELPRIVYQKAARRFRDRESAFMIAILRTAYFGKRREVGVVYRESANDILLITIHPLKSNQLENRIRSGRWKEIP